MQHQNIDHFRSGSNGESNYYYQEQGYNSKEVHKKPYFEIVQNPKTGQGGRNVTTAEGGKAILLCTVRHLEDNYTVRKYLKKIFRHAEYKSARRDLNFLWEKGLSY